MELSSAVSRAHDVSAPLGRQDVTQSQEVLQVNIDLAPASASPLASLKGKSLKELFGSDSLFIPVKKVNELVSHLGLNNAKQLLPFLVELAKPFSRCPISHFRVGVAGIGKSGAIYLGINIEFLCPLNYAVHGEQFLLANARAHGEDIIETIALPAEPCGHCRQFMYETGINIEILIPDSPPKYLLDLLPNPFGPETLKIQDRLLIRPIPFSSTHENPLIAKAIEAAHDSYAPHSQSPSGVSIKTKNEKIYTGSYLENAAYNPSLAPLQTALVSLIADGGDYPDIVHVVLVERSEKKFSHKGSTQDLLSTIAPEAKFEVITVDQFI